MSLTAPGGERPVEGCLALPVSRPRGRCPASSGAPEPGPHLWRPLRQQTFPP
jgi:hypothetical protein